MNLETISQDALDVLEFILLTIAALAIRGIFSYFSTEIKDQDGLSVRDKVLSALKVFPRWILSQKFNALILITISIFFGFLLQSITSPTINQLVIPFPRSRVTVDGNSIGVNIPDLIDPQYISGTFRLESAQDSDGWTVPIQSLTYAFENPSTLEALGGSPIRAISSRVMISPNRSPYGAEYIFCHFSVVFNGLLYTSTEQHVPFDQWTTIVWDFTGREWALPEEAESTWESALSALNRYGPSHTYFFRRLGELWQYQVLASKSYSANSITDLRFVCHVSATRDIVGGTTGDTHTFEGTFTFGDIFLEPYEY